MCERGILCARCLQHCLQSHHLGFLLLSLPSLIMCRFLPSTFLKLFLLSYLFFSAPLPSFPLSFYPLLWTPRSQFTSKILLILFFVFFFFLCRSMYISPGTFKITLNFKGNCGRNFVFCHWSPIFFRFIIMIYREQMRSMHRSGGKE